MRTLFDACRLALAPHASAWMGMRAGRRLAGALAPVCAAPTRRGRHDQALAPDGRHRPPPDIAAGAAQAAGRRRRVDRARRRRRRREVHGSRDARAVAGPHVRGDPRASGRPAASLMTARAHGPWRAGRSADPPARRSRSRSAAVDSTRSCWRLRLRATAAGIRAPAPACATQRRASWSATASRSRSSTIDGRPTRTALQRPAPLARGWRRGLAASSSATTRRSPSPTC